MKLSYIEPSSPRYVYINPKTNQVHLLMPIMSGTEIGLDNTCKAVYSLQEFFGLLGTNKENSAVESLEAYKSALIFDLKYMSESAEKNAKKDRLSQIETYLQILKELQQAPQITEPLMKRFPMYPKPLERLMKEASSNLHRIILRPFEQDIQLRATAILPTFSANHDQLDNPLNPPHSFLGMLPSKYESVSFSPKSKEELIARFMEKHKDLADFDEIREALVGEIKDYLGISVDLQQTQGIRYLHVHAESVPITKSYMDEQLGIDKNNPATTEEYLRGLLGYCTPNLFVYDEDSPFYTIQDTEGLSILTQFFLAELNIICKEEGLTKADFGQILESDETLVDNLAKPSKMH